MSTTAREVTGIIPHMTLSYVARALGPEAAARVVELAGDARPMAQLLRDDEWSSVDQAVALADAATAVCGELDMGRRVGEELVRLHEQQGTMAYLRAEGDPASALDSCVKFATKMSSGRSFRIIEQRDHGVVVESRMTELHTGRHPFFCGIAAAYWAYVPSLFDAIGAVGHPECLARGDGRCLMIVTWDRAPSEPDVELSKQWVDHSVERFEELQAMASDLARADNVSTVLDRIVRGVGVMTMAPRFLLAVRVDDEEALEVHQLGFSDAEALEAANAVVDGESLERFGVPLVVDVASPNRHYGSLAAFFPRESEPSDTDLRFLTAYAGHATAALEAAANLEETRRNRDTAQSLLRLAEALSRTVSRDEVADRLAEAVPGVTGCPAAAVWLWDSPAQALRLAGSYPAAPEGSSTRVLFEDGMPGLLDFAHAPHAIVFDEGDVPELHHGLFREWGVSRCFVVPILARNEFVGIVSAGVKGASTRWDTDVLFSKLEGVAHLAATAFDNAALLERIRHQAMHDALTGLPNRPLVEDRAAQSFALARRSGTRRGLLFIDLDHFKKVNDSLGHAAGDQLMRQVAVRLGTLVRASDTVARLGGDEFVVLLNDIHAEADAVAVAEKINEATRRPFHIGGRALLISASVGVACFPEDGEDYETLSKHADAAMYEAKSRGRDTYAVFAKASDEHTRKLLHL